MKAPRFTKWFAALPALNQPQRLKVLDALRPAAGLHELLALLERTTCATRRCPHCQCEHWHRHGHANDLQRYRCRACRRSFNDLTGTPPARLAGPLPRRGLTLPAELPGLAPNARWRESHFC